MSSSRQLRVVRSAVAASVATFVALVSHVIGGGAVPGLLGFAVPLVLSMLVVLALAGRRLSLWRLSLSVTVSQLLFHTLFVLGTPSNGGIQATSSVGHAMHSEITFVASASGSDQMAMMMAAGPTMWMWHGIAACVTIAALYRGERTLLRLRALAVQMIAWVRKQLAINPGELSPFPVVPTLSLGWSTNSLSDGPELSQLRRRGPPLPLAV